MTCHETPGRSRSTNWSLKFFLSKTSIALCCQIIRVPFSIVFGNNILRYWSLLSFETRSAIPQFKADLHFRASCAKAPMFLGRKCFDRCLGCFLYQILACFVLKASTGVPVPEKRYEILDNLQLKYWYFIQYWPLSADVQLESCLDKEIA